MLMGRFPRWPSMNASTHPSQVELAPVPLVVVVLDHLHAPEDTLRANDVSQIQAVGACEVLQDGRQRAVLRDPVVARPQASAGAPILMEDERRPSLAQPLDTPRSAPRREREAWVVDGGHEA